MRYCGQLGMYAYNTVYSISHSGHSTGTVAGGVAYRGVMYGHPILGVGTHTYEARNKKWQIFRLSRVLLCVCVTVCVCVCVCVCVWVCVLPILRARLLEVPMIGFSSNLVGG